MLTLAFVTIALTVIAARERVAQWAVKALARSGYTEKALALELGRDLGKLSCYVHNGTLQLADVIAMPQAIRAPILEDACLAIGLPLLRVELRRAARKLEAELLASMNEAQLRLF